MSILFIVFIPLFTAARSVSKALTSFVNGNYVSVKLFSELVIVRAICCARPHAKPSLLLPNPRCHNSDAGEDGDEVIVEVFDMS